MDIDFRNIKKIECCFCRKTIDLQNTNDSIYYCCTLENASCLKCARKQCASCTHKKNDKIDRNIIKSKIKEQIKMEQSMSLSAKYQENSSIKDNKLSNEFQNSQKNDQRKVFPPKRLEPIKQDKKCCMTCDISIYVCSGGSIMEDEILLCETCKQMNYSYAHQQKSKQSPILHLKPIPIKKSQNLDLHPIVEIACINCNKKFIKQKPQNGSMQDEVDLPLCMECRKISQKEEERMTSSQRFKPQKPQTDNFNLIKKKREQQHGIGFKDQKYEPISELKGEPIYESKKYQKEVQSKSIPLQTNRIKSITQNTIIRSKSEDLTDLKRKYSIEEPADPETLNVELEEQYIPKMSQKSGKSQNQKNNSTFLKPKMLDLNMELEFQAQFNHPSQNMMSCMQCKYSLLKFNGFYYCLTSKQIQHGSIQTQQSMIEENLWFLCSHCIRTNVVKPHVEKEFIGQENQYILDDGFRVYN